MMITLDGAHGEGGGQILRTALALSMITLKPFRIENIRKNRPTPGLKQQHLTGIRALQLLSDSAVDCAGIGSESLLFAPKTIKNFRATIDIRTAGSITLLLQTILPPLLFARKESRIRIIGGTDVTWSPEMDYFTNVIAPSLERFAEITVKIEKRGYYPKGDGKIDIRIKPKFPSENFEELSAKLKSADVKFDLLHQDNLLFIKGVSHASKDLVGAEVAERQARAAKMALNKFEVPIAIRTEYSEAESIGSGITLFAGFSKTDEMDIKNPVVIGADNLGEKSKRSETVGEEAAKKLIEEIGSGAAVDAHLADNLIPYMALIGGKMKTSKITNHILSNIHVAEQFLDVKFKVDNDSKIIGVD